MHFNSSRTKCGFGIAKSFRVAIKEVHLMFTPLPIEIVAKEEKESSNVTGLAYKV